MGIPGQMLRQQAHLVDNVLHLADPVFLVLVELEVVQALGNNVVHGSPLVQGSGRVLEHHLDVPDDLPVQALGGLAGNADALVLDLTGGAGVDPDHGPADGGLAGAGLAYQGEGLALVNVKAGILDGPDGAVALAEGDVHIFQAQQDLPAVFIQRTMLRQMRNTGGFFFFTHSRILLKC